MLSTLKWVLIIGVLAFVAVWTVLCILYIWMIYSDQRTVYLTPNTIFKISDTNIPHFHRIQEFWLHDQKYRDRENPARHCCGPADCAIFPPEQVQITPDGYLLHLGDGKTNLIPYEHVIDSKDQHYWRCHRAPNIPFSDAKNHEGFWQTACFAAPHKSSQLKSTIPGG